MVAVEHGGVVLEEHLAADGTVNHGLDLLVGRPDVLQIHVIAVCVGTERLGLEVEVHRAGKRVGDDQRRGGQVVHLDIRADAAFEVAVSGQHGGDGQVVGVDGFGDLGQQRSGVADAGGAAEADQLVAERVEIVLEARGLEVVGHDLRAGGERGLDPRLGAQSLGVRVAGDQAGGDHHGRVGGVVAVFDVEIATEVGGHGHRVLDGLVGLVGGRGLLEHVLRLGQQDAVLWALRAGDGRHDRAEVELLVFGVLRLDIVRVGGVAPQPVGLGVRLDKRDLLLGTSGQTQVVERDAVNREDAAGGAELRSHVADGGAVGQWHRGDALAIELDELADHAVLAQHVGDGQDHVGGGDALGNRTGELEADDARHEHGDRLAEHGRLGLDAAHAPAEHAQAVLGGGVRVGADAGVEVGELVAIIQAGGLRHDNLRQVFDVDLVNDAGSRRHHAEVAERLLAPAQELVAFAVALVFDVHVLLDRVSHAVLVDLHGMVDDHVGLDLRVDDLRVAAEILDRVAHGGEVHDAGHAGEVLHDHTRGRELDFMAGLGLRVPVQQRLDVFVRDVRAVDVAYQVLDEDLERVRQMVDAGQVGDAVVVIVLAGHVQCRQLVVSHRHASSEIK